MKTQTRRTFLQECAAAGICSALGWTGCVTEPREGEVFPEWKPGEMDLHFIYTGCGENLFYRLPDGTAILNDTGDFYRPKDLAEVPLLPNDRRLGGEWVSRYLQRVYPERTFDYAIFSHWHTDHIGHAIYDQPETPEVSWRFKTLPDGRKVNGFLCVAEDFRVRTVMTHQYGNYGQYSTQETGMNLLLDWMDRERPRGLKVEPFRVGAMNQIALQRDPEKYRDVFSVRNLCANGVAWDGQNGVRDFAAEHIAATGAKFIDQNQLSMGFVIQYGKFRYFTGGDIQHNFYRNAKGPVNYEAFVARACGPVSVCKMSHHGCTNAMSAEFAQTIQAQVYTNCGWCPQQAHPIVLKRLASVPAAADGKRPLLLPNLVANMQWSQQTADGYELQRRGAMHVVVKVFPGGEAYRVYLLDANDESMRILATFDRNA